MAVSHNTYFPRAYEPTWKLSTQEEVSLKVNTDIFNPDGRLKGQARFSVDRDHQLFMLSWPKLAVRCVSTLSRWRIVITKATDDRIASFNSSTAKNMGTNQWEVVKKVVEDCRDKFCARLLSMSCREIVFAHEDRQSAEKMKDSNEMVDIMNTLLADVEFLFHDIMVDWEVEVTPVTVSLSYQPVVDTEEQDGHLGSLIFTDADTLTPVSFTAEGMGMGSSGGRHSKSDEGAITLMVQSEVEGRLVRESVKRAYLEDEVKPPKAKSFDTVLCLDISNSMKEGGAFEQMKRTVLQFIEGVEDIVTMHGVEENMGLVTFGDRADVVQNLTNDFNLIRDKIELLKPGGKSPFVEALLVAMAAFVRKGGIVSVSGEWQVKPRIIFISDGLPTESAEKSDHDYAHNLSNVRLSLSNLLISFKKGNKSNKVHPVFFVPVGQKADKNYMKAMSTICDGEFVEPENITGLCHYFRVQESIGKVLVCLRTETEDLSPQKIEATMMALTPDLTEEEKTQVNEVVHRELSNPNRTRSHLAKPGDLENVFEHTEKVNEGKKLPLGTRVIRGPDWSYGDQDGGGPGTVINHNETQSIHLVYWDTGDYNRYGYSNNRGFDIWKTEDYPRLKKDNELLDIGMTVKRGKDWKPAEDLAVQGTGQGVIIRKSRPKFMVRWSNGVFQNCSWSLTGLQEVDYCPPGEDPDSSHRPSSPGPAFQQSQCNEPAPAKFEGQGVWQWCDEKNVWHPYDEKINREIEAACKKRNPRTCIIQKKGKQCRIMFRKMVEKVIDQGNECKIRRLHHVPT